MKLIIKNMVCDRCIKVVRDLLNTKDILFIKVELGCVHLSQDMNAGKVEKLNELLKVEGFEILKDKEQQIVEGVKFTVVSEVRGYTNRTPVQSFQEILSHDLKINYSKISRLFSQVEGKSIERFVILQKIERAKELMTYNELTMSEIAYELNYSSPQHLSKQFKQVTGFSPTEFRGIASREKLDNI
ncbi:MAG: AraC family transcriptional regulator [Crocinitomicaceae bacterium]|nr:AraC family transcriptional regulator [Crocinitomicaceae bacterium]